MVSGSFYSDSFKKRTDRRPWLDRGNPAQETSDPDKENDLDQEYMILIKNIHGEDTVIKLVIGSETLSTTIYPLNLRVTGYL